MKWYSNFNLGLLAGVVVGLLIAPAKGSETRGELLSSIKRGKEKIEEFFIDDDELKALKDALKDESAEITEDVRHRLLRFLKEIPD